MKRSMMYRRTSLGLGMLTAVLFLFTACAGITDPPGRLDPHFGEYFHTAFSAQAINPTAPADPSPAMGLPGDLADKIYKQRYVKPMTEEKKEKEDASSELSGLD